MASSDEKNDDIGGKRVHRRGFFAEGFRNLLRPLGDILEERLEGLDASAWRDASGKRDRTARPESLSRGSRAPGAATPGPEADASSRTLLRPPGALPEEQFLGTCTTSGRCVEACPVSAIRPAWSDDPSRARKPVIEARLQACVVCDDLSCMKVCPSGALRDVGREQMAMGTAVVDHDLCVRSQGEDCQICVDKCPVGPAALEIPHYGDAVVVHTDACVGCGVCEMYCPTAPRAITVEPKERLGTG